MVVVLSLKEEGGDPIITPLAGENFIYSAYPHPEHFGTERKWEAHTAEKRAIRACRRTNTDIPCFAVLIFIALHRRSIFLQLEIKTFHQKDD